MNENVSKQMFFPSCFIQVALGSKNSELLKQTQGIVLNVF